ncbi:MAG TPA: hypothetical protein VFH51_11885 [Myxococcota bacterium]|nr:hypothetical protein [Myxococcota bacterium]
MSHSEPASQVPFVVVALAIAVLGCAAEFATFARSDMAFLLYAAERVLDGARLYVDVVEINPPLIVAWNMPAVVLARLIGMSDVLTLRIWDSLVLLGALGFALWALWHALAPDRARFRVIGLVLAAALFLAPGNDFAQREHLLVALVLPYILLAAARIEGRPAPIGIALAAGVIAGLGLALKPHFFLVWLCVEGYAAWRARARWPAPEALGLASFLLVYAGAVVLLAPDFFRMALLLGSAYNSFGHYSFATVLVTARDAPEVLLAILACAALHRRARHPAIWFVLLLALIASYLAGAAQLKGWTYHFLPARVLALTLTGLVVLDVRTPLARGVERLYSAVAVAALASAVIWSSGMAVQRVLGRDPVRLNEQAQLDELVGAVRRRVPPNGSLYIFSYTIGSSFPLVNYAGVRWASRFPHLWIIEAAYHDQLTRDHPLRYHTPAQMKPAERYLNQAVAEDLARYRPDVIMVLRHARDVPENSLRRIDYLAYFSRDPRIARELRWYRYVEDVGQYGLYQRAPSLDQPGQRPVSEPGREDIVRARVAGGRALVADRPFVWHAVLFLLLVVLAYVIERRSNQRGNAGAGQAVL